MVKTTNQCRGRGPSSFWMQEPESVFKLLNILPGQHILDMGCGAGDYTLEAARLTGPSGLVIALDHWPPILDAMAAAARAEGLSQIRCITADITCPPLPVKEDGMDLCMAFTVLHIFGPDHHKTALFSEAARTLKPGGHLAVMECKKEEMPFGPPVQMRLSPEEIRALAGQYGFREIEYSDLGYNYLIRFALGRSDGVRTSAMDFKKFSLTDKG